MEKSIKSLVLGAVMAIGVLGASTAALANTQYVQTDMNFRNGPSTSAAAIGSVPAGAQVDVISSQNGWDLVNYNGTTGYIHGGNVAGSYTAPSSTASSSSYSSTKNYFDNNAGFSQKAQAVSTDSNYRKTVQVNGYLALRNAPSYDASNECGKLFTGDVVEVTNSQPNGSYVWVYSPKYDTYGYVNAGFLA